jgi:hypothetical protein
MHVKISVDPKAEIEREVFAQLGKGGDIANSDLEAICRLLSLFLRITGLRLDLPTEPTAPSEVALRAWAYVDSRTTGDCSAFFGFVFSDDYPTSGTGWSQALGWEVLSATTSRYQLVGATQAESVGWHGGWHWWRNLPRLTDKLTCASTRLTWPSGLPECGQPAAVAAVLGSWVQGRSSRSLTMRGPLDAARQSRITYALLMVQKIYQGNTCDDPPLWQRLSDAGSGGDHGGAARHPMGSVCGRLPLVSATRAPSRNVNDTPVWELTAGDRQGGQIYRGVDAERRPV